MLKVAALILIASFTALASTVAAGDAFRVDASTSNPGNSHVSSSLPDGKYLFASDVDNDRVAVLEAETLQLVNKFGLDHQGGTHDVDFDAAGRLYLADTHNGRVTIYEMSGARGRLVGGAWSGKLVVCENGNVVFVLKARSSPHDGELTQEGDVWLADAGNDRMVFLMPKLQLFREVSCNPCGFNGQRGQDVMPDGALDRRRQVHALGQGHRHGRYLVAGNRNWSGGQKSG